MPHDLLEEVEPAAEDASDEDGMRAIGFRYMLRAATAGDRGSMVFVARAFDTGCNLPDQKQRSRREAMR